MTKRIALDLSRKSKDSDTPVKVTYFDFPKFLKPAFTGIMRKEGVSHERKLYEESQMEDFALTAIHKLLDEIGERND